MRTSDKCCFCGAELTDSSKRNDPWPAKTEGFCCGLCNIEIVLPMRLKLMICRDKVESEETND